MNHTWSVFRSFSMKFYLQVVTIFLDQKREATNGFDVAQNDSGDVAVSSVRRHGPAEGKLQEGG